MVDTLLKTQMIEKFACKNDWFMVKESTTFVVCPQDDSFMSYLGITCAKVDPQALPLAVTIFSYDLWTVWLSMNCAEG